LEPLQGAEQQQMKEREREQGMQLVVVKLPMAL